jgi:O-antigen/teichoic acid export membrane protein
LTTTVAPPRRPTGGDPVARPDAAARPGETLAPPTGAGRVAAEQALVAGGQLAAGVGNLVFAVLAARLLEPRGFAQLAAFLALYLLVHVPASSLSAGSALTPALAARARRRALLAGGGIGAAVAAAAVPLSGPAGVPAGLLLVLAFAVPAAGWLALERGRLYGEGRHRRAASSLAVEPVVRLAVGIPLLAALGAVGGAIAVVLGGFAALAVTRPWTATDRSPDDARAGRFARAGGTASEAAAASAPARGALWAMLAFLGLAVVQNQDVVLANGVLDAGQAARFAVLSTLGGAAAFATTTVPLVLLPRAARGERHALATAIGAAVLLGAAAVAAIALVPDAWIAAGFGERYADVGALAVPYVAAMALFGVSRVLVAHRAATGGGPWLVAAVALAAAVQAAAVLAAADAGDVAKATLAATGLLLLAAGAVSLPRSGGRRRAPAAVVATGPREPRPAPDDRAAPAVGAALGLLVLVAFAIRVYIPRGIWLDEATSITQAQMPLGEMLESLRTTDVHPPLHHLIEWAIAHGTGSVSELAMRMPSVLAGTLMVPVLYLLGRELYDRRAALLAAALGTFAPFLLWYSQEARMYGLFMLFAALAMLGQLRALRRGGVADWALWAGATTGLLWTQYFGIFFTLVQQAGFLLVALGLRRAGRPVRGYLVRWLGAGALVALAFAPLVPFAVDQFQANQAAGKGFSSPGRFDDADAARGQVGIYVALTNFAWAVFGYHGAHIMAAITSVWPFAILGALLALGRRGRPLTVLVAACALAPAVICFALGILKPFLFEIRYFAGAVPLLLVLLARAATGWTRGAIATGAIAAVLVGGMALASADQQFSGNPRVYDFDGALAEIEDRAGPGDAVLYEPSYLNGVVDYYAPDLDARPLQGGLPREAAPRRIFLMASFQDQERHRQAAREAVARFRRNYRLVETERRPQVRTWVFERREEPRR